MPEEKVASLSPTQLKDILAEVIKEVKKPSIMEAKKLAEEEKRDANMLRSQIELATEEDKARKARLTSCTHRRDARTGHPTLDGEWTTQGQIDGSGKAALICLRCAIMWKWQPSKEVADLVTRGDADFRGMRPPTEAEVCAY